LTLQRGLSKGFIDVKIVDSPNHVNL